jgi:hypothetical protein
MRECVMAATASRHASAYYLALISLIVAGVGGLGDQAVLADGRIIVVGPNQGEQPLGPNETVTARKTVIINGEPITIVQVQPMPPKAKFAICVLIPRAFPPGGVECIYVSFPPDRDEGGVHISHEHWLASPGGGAPDYIVVVSRSCIPAGVCEGCKTAFPPGSILIPDPPQPSGLAFMADRFPADPATESAVLASLGLPNNPWPEVWVLTTGDLYFFTDSNPPGPPVHISPATQPGDLNCDGVVNAFDIGPFVLALIDPTGYYAAYPNCGYFYADVNDDAAVNVLDVDSFVTLLMAS